MDHVGGLPWLLEALCRHAHAAAEERATDNLCAGYGGECDDGAGEGDSCSEEGGAVAFPEAPGVVAMGVFGEFFVGDGAETQGVLGVEGVVSGVVVGVAGEGCAGDGFEGVGGEEAPGVGLVDAVGEPFEACDVEAAGGGDGDAIDAGGGCGGVPECGGVGASCSPPD